MPKVAGQQHAWHQRLSRLETERSRFESVWREIEENIAPKTLRLDISEYNEGEKQHQKVLDETVLRARRVFTAGFVSGMTSPSRPWFKLVTPDAELSEHHSIRVWLDEVEKRIGLVLSRSNFYQAIARAYDDLGTYGTCAVTCLENFDSVVWFYPHPVGTYFVSQNDKGLVDTVYRETTRTVRQLVETFGIENVSNQTASMWNANNLEEQVRVYNAIEPNDDRVMDRKDFENMPYRSVWWEYQANNNQYLGKRGFQEFPTMAGRWYATSLDDYGVDCPGITSLQGCKQLYHDTKRMAQAIDKTVNPPVQAPSSMKRGNQVNLLPGGLNWYDAATPNSGIQPLFNMNFPVQELGVQMQEVRNRINESWFVDMFLMISQEDDVRTATEVMIRNEEKLLVLGPVLTRVQTEVLDPVIDRVFNIMARNDLLPPPPPELEGVDLRVEYISMLAQAQQSVGAQSIERLVNTAAAMGASGFPNALDKIDEDAVIEEYGGILGVPSRLLRSDEDVSAMRQDRAQRAQQQEQMAMAEQAAKAAKTASEVDTSEGSAFDRLTNG